MKREIVQSEGYWRVKIREWSKEWRIDRRKFRKKDEVGNL